jgi:phosphatidyl-myo-inositol dimannoside synthase
MKNSNILFLTLKVFSATGGIEKVCQIAGKALYEFGMVNNTVVKIYSMHDAANSAENNQYFPNELFYGYAANRVSFIYNATKAGAIANLVILSHINLLPVAWLIKKRNPKVKVILMAHGIEIWDALPASKQKFMHVVDTFACVSSFTKSTIEKVHAVPNSRTSVLNNCIDPFLNASLKGTTNVDLKMRYGINSNDIVLLTLTRITERDRYKGYDVVIKAIAELVKFNAGIKYMLAGGYQPTEKKYIDDLLLEFNVQSNVILTGYVKNEELAAHFNIADIYVMPSVKEGFGIVFVEAMLYGLPVIAANVDGSTDALLQGRLGTLVNPNAPDEIVQAVKKIIANKQKYTPSLSLVNTYFSYEAYKTNFENLIHSHAS